MKHILKKQPIKLIVICPRSDCERILRQQTVLLITSYLVSDSEEIFSSLNKASANTIIRSACLLNTKSVSAALRISFGHRKHMEN